MKFLALLPFSTSIEMHLLQRLHVTYFIPLSLDYLLVRRRAQCQHCELVYRACTGRTLAALKTVQWIWVLEAHHSTFSGRSCFFHSSGFHNISCSMTFKNVVHPPPPPPPRPQHTSITVHFCSLPLWDNSNALLLPSRGRVFSNIHIKEKNARRGKIHFKQGRGKCRNDELF